MKKLLALIFLLASAGAALAESDEAIAKKALEAMFDDPLVVDSVRSAGILNLLEVEAGGDVFYVDRKGGYVLAGDIIDVKTRKNLTEERRNRSAKKLIESSYKLALKQVRGNGKRVLVTFEDPNCGYCKKLVQELRGLTDATIYTFLLPILSQDSVTKSVNIWCAPDRVKAWNDWMVNRVEPPPGKCAAPITELSALGSKLRVHGTPAIYFPDGSKAPGFVPLAEIEKGLNAPSL